MLRIRPKTSVKIDIDKPRFIANEMTNVPKCLDVGFPEFHLFFFAGYILNNAFFYHGAKRSSRNFVASHAGGINPVLKKVLSVQQGKALHRGVLNGNGAWLRLFADRKREE
ncbi:MAG: hypothetical protein PHS57_07105 [Alphaproteobacteria bacterium]|nr:hypothetical protein [Alphaproteobacteria bacterium]